jgi:hypothetical protein
VLYDAESKGAVNYMDLAQEMLLRESGEYIPLSVISELTAGAGLEEPDTIDSTVDLGVEDDPSQM